MSIHCDNQGCSKEGILRCATCKIRYYCSKECQAFDWRSRHKIGCGITSKGLCDQCRREPGFKKCSGCNVVRYCSAACQKKNWPLHKDLCNKYADPKSSALLAKLHPSFLLSIVKKFFMDNGLKFADYKGTIIVINSEELFEDHEDYSPFLTITPMSEELLRLTFNTMDHSGATDRKEIITDQNIFILVTMTPDGGWCNMGVDRKLAGL